jgi:hypothetical protein
VLGADDRLAVGKAFAENRAGMEQAAAVEGVKAPRNAREFAERLGRTGRLAGVLRRGRRR